MSTRRLGVTVPLNGPLHTQRPTIERLERTLVTLYHLRIALLREVSPALHASVTGDTRELLGVSILGEGASELVHIGQAVLAMGGTIDYFVDTVFNYPTLAECYKTAAFDGINRLG